MENTFLPFLSILQRRNMGNLCIYKNQLSSRHVM